MPTAPSAQPAIETTLVDAIISVITGYRDDHLTLIKSSRDPNWVLWHADAAAASAEIIDLIREPAASSGGQPKLAASATAA
jgi:hypothetical protein